MQGGVTLIASVLRSATAVKMKINGQLEIFAIVNGQITISLIFSARSKEFSELKPKIVIPMHCNDKNFGSRSVKEF